MAGLDWDGPVRVQSEHLAEYRAVLDQLASRALLYPCFCTRAEIEREAAASAAAPHGPDGAPLYPGTCRRMPPAERAARLGAGQPHALRLDMDAALESAPRLLAYTDWGKDASAAIPPGSATPCWPARTLRPAIIFASRMTMRRKA